MRSGGTINLNMHYPSTDEGKRELAKRAADVHADFVISTIDRLCCTTQQKLELLQAVIDTAKGIYKPERCTDPPEKDG